MCVCVCVCVYSVYSVYVCLYMLKRSNDFSHIWQMYSTRQLHNLLKMKEEKKIAKSFQNDLYSLWMVRKENVISFIYVEWITVRLLQNLKIHLSTVNQVVEQFLNDRKNTDVCHSIQHGLSKKIVFVQWDRKQQNIL